jgi:CheY-like chemotaxis protein
MARKSIVLVEDDEAIRDVVQALLDLEGYEVAAACTGLEGVGLVERLVGTGDTPPPGLILLDLMMPVMDGWQFLEERQRNARLAGIPVVILSARDDQGGRVLDANGFLRKPFARDDLLRVVREHCG